VIALWLAIAAAAGTLIRWHLSRSNLGGRHAGTLVVNVVAAFVLGVLIGSSAETVTIVGVGHLGALSTFSTVVAEATDDAGRGSRIDAVVYVAVTIVGGVGAALLGISLG